MQLLLLLLLLVCSLNIKADDKLDKTISYLTKEAERQEQENKLDSAAMSRREIISVYSRVQQDSMVIVEAPKQMKWMEQHGMWVYYYRAWRLLAESYYFNHKPQTALHEAQRMLDHAQKRNDNVGRATAYQQLGFFYLEIDNSEAIKAYQNSLVILKAQGYNDETYGSLNRSYGYLCEAFDNEKDYATELRYCNEWEQMVNQWTKSHKDKPLGNSIKRVIIELYLQKASALIGLSRLQEASITLSKAEELNQKEQDEYYNYMAMVRRAQIAYLSGDISQAVKLSDAYAPTMATDDWKPARLIRGDILMRAGRTDDAARLYRSLYEHQDSTFARDMRMQLDELNTIFRVDELEMKGQLERSRFIILIVVLVALALGIFIYFRHRAARRLEKAHNELLTAYEKLEETTTAKERIESELRIARDIQMSMVPSIFPKREGLDLYASMTPAREVGGDLYDYLLEDNTLYFCLGDVSGKGVPASLFMAQAIRLFRALAKQHQMPAIIATRLNEELTEKNDNGMFVTMFIGLVDLQNGHLEFCNAGHNPPVLGGDALHGSFIEMESNAPIGLWPDLEYVGEEINSIKGKPLFVYTDGLNEAENTEQEQLGDEHLLELLRETQFNSARQVIEHLQAAVELHRNGAEPNDDLTMLCLKVN